VARSYALETLYRDQPPDLVIDTIPALLAWLPPSSTVTTATFRVRHGRRLQRVTR